MTLVSLICLSGCADEQAAKKENTAPPVMQAEPTDEPEVVLPSQLRRQLKANENAQFKRVGNDIVEVVLFQSGVKSIEPLQGLPLRSLDLGMTEVTDLSPLKGMNLTSLILENTAIDDLSVVKGMPLELLYLQNTKVTDLTVLDGMPLRQLNLMNVPVEDLSAIATLPLETLWVPGTKVKDISPLKGKPMVSLDIQGTEVASLDALSGMKTLKRLNISKTPITDISPLQGLDLQRITLSPETVKTGIEVLRSMPSLNEILTTMEGPRQSATDFWKKYDAGVWKDSETPKGASEESADDSNGESKPTTVPNKVDG